MKLKRLLCALVVFTLMMTSVVCSVSAATYKTTTVYNVSSNPDELGTVSLKTEIAGADEGSMISYIIYNNNVKEGAEAADNKVDVDGADIEYIDQKTVGESGNVTFGTEAKFPTDAISGRRYVFASSGGEEFVYEALTNSSSKKIGNNAVDIIDQNWKVNMSAQAGHVTVKFEEHIRGQEETNSGYLVRKEGDSWKTHTEKIYPDSKVVLTTIPEPGYYISTVNIHRAGNVFNGGNAVATGGTAAKLPPYHIGNKLKLDLSDGKIGTYAITGAGDNLSVRMVATALTDEEAATAQYIKVDSQPIYTRTDDGYLSVTFLMTKSATIDDPGVDTADFGINVYAFPVGTTDTTLSGAEATFKGLKAEYVDNNRFGIQLITAQTTADGVAEENAKYFDSSKYELVAVPYYDGAELANSGVASLFYITDNETDLSGGTFEEVAE